MDKYFDGNYLKFHVKSEDETLDEKIRINESLVEDVKEFVEFLKIAYGGNLADKMFEVFMEFSLMHGLSFLSENKEAIIELSGD